MAKNKPENYEDRFDKIILCVNDMKELIRLARLLIYDAKNLTDSERVEKIWNAIDLFYDKWENEQM